MAALWDTTTLVFTSRTGNCPSCNILTSFMASIHYGEVNTLFVNRIFPATAVTDQTETNSRLPRDVMPDQNQMRVPPPGRTYIRTLRFKSRMRFKSHSGSFFLYWLNDGYAALGKRPLFKERWFAKQISFITSRGFFCGPSFSISAEFTSYSLQINECKWHHKS